MDDIHFTHPHPAVNTTETPVVIARLVDGDGLVYDVRGVTAGDVPSLNAIAQQETDGELWWETIDSANLNDLLHHASDWSIGARVAEFFADETAAQRFKRNHPDWRVFLTVATHFELDENAAPQPINDEAALAGMGYLKC